MTIPFDEPMFEYADGPLRGHPIPEATRLTGREHLLNARITDLVNRIEAVEGELRIAMRLIAQLQGEQ